jgi:hypothetical protein
MGAGQVTFTNSELEGPAVPGTINSIRFGNPGGWTQAVALTPKLVFFDFPRST